MTAPYFPPLDQVTTAVLGLLRGSASQTPADWARRVYDGAFGGDPLNPAYPYSILYRVTGGSADPMPDLDLDLRAVTVAYQVTTAANVRNQCEDAARRIRDLLLARTLDRPDQAYPGPGAGWVHDLPLPAGWACTDRRPDPAMPGVDRTGEYPAVLFNQPARYLITITPTV